MNNLSFDKIDKTFDRDLQPFLLFYSAKSCYVISRFCMEVTFGEFYTPGFLLMQQCLENFIKAFLKERNITGNIGSKGHKLIELVNLGNVIPFFKNKILNRIDFVEFLTELEKGYNIQRYGESGYSIKDMDRMINLLDELVHLFITEFAILVNQPNNERLTALSVPPCMETIFKRKLKIDFITSETFSLD